MRKLTALILSLIMVFSLSLPALAVAVAPDALDVTTTGTDEEIIYQESYQNARGGGTSTVTVTSRANPDGSYTISQYNNGRVLEAHTTIPGSGVVYHKEYLADGTVLKTTEITNQTAYSTNNHRSTSTRHLGYMHYRNPYTQQIFSINCTVIDEQHVNEPYTLHAGTAATLAQMISEILSVWAFVANPANLVKQMIDTMSDVGLLEHQINGIISVLITKTIYCTYYNQEIVGTPTQPSGVGQEHSLYGTYCFLTNVGNTQIKSEGFTVREWGNPSMGLLMMFNVFGIDEAPTSWTNLNN